MGLVHYERPSVSTPSMTVPLGRRLHRRIRWNSDGGVIEVERQRFRIGSGAVEDARRSVAAFVRSGNFNRSQRRALCETETGRSTVLRRPGLARPESTWCSSYSCTSEPASCTQVRFAISTKLCATPPRLPSSTAGSGLASGRTESRTRPSIQYVDPRPVFDVDVRRLPIGWQAGGVEILEKLRFAFRQDDDSPSDQDDACTENLSSSPCAPARGVTSSAASSRRSRTAA